MPRKQKQNEISRFVPQASEIFGRWVQGYRARIAAYDDEGRVLVEDQAHFHQAYLCCMAIDGASASNLRRIRRFFKLQSGVLPAKLQIVFWGGIDSGCYAYINSINDIDIADAYDITNFKIIAVRKKDKSKWSRAEAAGIVRAIEDDLAFDGYDLKLSYAIGHELEITRTNRDRETNRRRKRRTQQKQEETRKLAERAR
jgi:hypothetical protein